MSPQRRRRRRKCADGEHAEALKDNAAVEESGDEVEDGDGSQSGARMLKRECPIPKPGGLVGEILGFKSNGSSSDGKGSKPP
jgi:cytochrome c oxidase assembly factor 2